MSQLRIISAESRIMDDPHWSSLHNWFTANFTVGTFIGAAGGRVRYALQQRTDARGLVIVVSGRTEFIEKYLEVADDLQDSGFSICLYDHYGQGGSDRSLDDREKGHIDDFSIYVADLLTLIDRVASRVATRPVVLLCHSMGGTIATLALARSPHLAEGLVLVSPMLQINTGLLLPPTAVEAVSGMVCRLGGAKRYVWDCGLFRASRQFTGNELTGDARRFSRNRQLPEENSKLALGRPTFGWLQQAYRAMREARRSAGLITCPALLLVPLADKVVGLAAMEWFARELRQGIVQRYDGAKHELLMERDPLRDGAIAEIKGFLKARAQS